MRAAVPASPSRCSITPQLLSRTFSPQSLALCARGRLAQAAQASVVAGAATADQMKVYTARDLSNAQLKDLTARPRIDFDSILDRVSDPCPATTAPSPLSAEAKL